jgi:hypothetical protein
LQKTAQSEPANTPTGEHDQDNPAAGRQCFIFFVSFCGELNGHGLVGPGVEDLEVALEDLGQAAGGPARTEILDPGTKAQVVAADDGRALRFLEPALDRDLREEDAEPSAMTRLLRGPYWASQPPTPAMCRLGMNNLNQVVGAGPGAAFGGHACLWTEGGGLLDLNTLIPANGGWTL